MKKIVVFLLLSVMILSLVACTETSKEDPVPQPKQEESNNEQVSQQQKSDKLFDKPTEISMFFSSHGSWPYQDDWYIINKIKEKTNVVLKADAVPSTGFNDKFNITMASGELPNIMLVSRSQAHQYGKDGAFLNILDHIDEMPNFKKWYNEHKDFVMNSLSYDGKLYGLPVYGLGETNRRGWLYRKDVFDKLNLKMPTNEEEFYEVLKALKKEYPDSYPFTFRIGNAMRKFKELAPSWGTSSEGAYPPDRSKNEWVLGQIEDNYKSMVDYYNKLYKEGLIPPDFLTLNTKAWQDQLSTDKSFITFDYLSRIDFFNGAMRESNAEYTMAYMKPPKFGENGVAKLPYTSVLEQYWAVSSSAKNRDDILKYIDWLYTDEAVELVSWGEEGETYKVVDGKRQWIDAPTVADIRKKHGLSTYGMYILFDYDAHIVTFTPELAEAIKEDQKYDLPQHPQVAFNDEETEINKTIGMAVLDTWQEQISRFIVGDRPMSEWDQYVEEIKALGLDKFLKIHKDAYQRQLDMMK